jgi:hypothetical protein
VKEDKYAKELIKKVKELEIGLDYYIKHSQQLENELNQYKLMYENRVEEYLKLTKQVEYGGTNERGRKEGY